MVEEVAATTATTATTRASVPTTLSTTAQWATAGERAAWITSTDRLCHCVCVCVWIIGTLHQCLKPSPKKVIDGLAVRSAFSMLASSVLWFLCGTQGHKTTVWTVSVRAELWLNLVVWSVLSLVFLGSYFHFNFFLSLLLILVTKYEGWRWRLLTHSLWLVSFLLKSCVVTTFFLVWN